jgi:hypothetical protein
MLPAIMTKAYKNIPLSSVKEILQAITKQLIVTTQIVVSNTIINLISVEV